MKYKKFIQTDDSGEEYVELHFKWEDKDNITCYHCGTSLKDDPAIYFCKKGKLYICVSCETATKRVESRRGDTSWEAPAFKCPFESQCKSAFPGRKEINEAIDPHQHKKLIQESKGGAS